MKQTSVEFLEEKLQGHLDISRRYWNELLAEAKEMELEQKEKVNLLLNTLLENNMCSVAGDELIKQFKKK
jgi:hypothetical protein